MQIQGNGSNFINFQPNEKEAKEDLYALDVNLQRRAN